MNEGSTSRRTLISGSLMSRSTLTSTTSVSMSNNSSNPTMIANRYCVGRKIGFGNFGEVRLGKDVTNGTYVAVKLESRRTRIPQLKDENQFYQILGRSEGIPNIYYYGPFISHNALVLEYLGPNLEQLFMKCGRKFCYKTVLLIAMQLVRRFEYVHSRGIIFRDVKPENFVVGNGSKEGIIYIIDFGLAKPYINWETNKHIPFCTNKNLSGTARYMSVNIHLGYEQSRRDDLESLGYMLIYFLRGALPWQGLKAENIFDRYAKIGHVKKTTTIETLCYKLADEWNQYMNYVKQLKFDQKPDYDFLYSIFFKACLHNGYAVDNKFEWCYQASFNYETPQCTPATLERNNLNEPHLDDGLGFYSNSRLQHFNSFTLATPQQRQHQHQHQCIDGGDVDYNAVESSENHFIASSNVDKNNCGGAATPTSGNRIVTSTILNDMKHNQQTRIDRFRSHARKPTPSHFCSDKRHSNKKHNRNLESTPDTPGVVVGGGYRHSAGVSSDSNAPYGRLDSFKASFWNCCYKLRKSHRIGDNANQ